MKINFVVVIASLIFTVVLAQTATTTSTSTLTVTTTSTLTTSKTKPIEPTGYPKQSFYDGGKPILL